MSSSACINDCLPGILSPDAVPFTPMSQENRVELGSVAATGVQFNRCASKLRSLRAGNPANLKTELNILFDQLISENYTSNYSDVVVLCRQEVCTLLVHVTRLVPLSQEHLVVKLCQLTHHLLNQLQVVVDEQTLDVCMCYAVQALGVCNPWTHSEILLALSTLVYGNGPHCHRHLGALLGDDGILRLYSDPSHPDMELRRAALTCLANLCLSVPGQASLEEPYRSVCFKVFLQTLQSPQPPDADPLLYCMMVQGAVKGLQASLSGGKWRFGGSEELGALLAVLKRFMFHGCPGVCVEWLSVLYPAPLPQYETFCPLNLSICRGRKAGEEEEVEREVRPGPPGGGRTWPKTPGLPPSPAVVSSLASFWKMSSSDSEFSDPEGAAHSKLRLYHSRVRQGVLLCLLTVVKAVDRRTLYGYWSSFIPDTPIGGPPPLTLLTIVLKDPSPKVRTCALQVLSALLEGSRQFLGVAEDLAPPRTSYTPFSFSMATTVRELHRSLSLALLAESSPHTLTQVVKCLAHLVGNAPYNRLRPGLLSPLWRQIRPYLRHRDVNVRVSVLTLYGALVSAQAPLPEIQLLLTQPHTPPPQDTRNSQTPHTHTPPASHTPGEEESRVPWLLQLCVSLVTQPRDDQSDSEGPGGGASVLEPSPVRLEALQERSQTLCITVLLGLTFSDNSLVKAAAVRALGVYILFPCLREDVMFVADTANAILTALDDRSPNVRAKAAWSLGNLTDTLIVNMGCLGEVFQEELSDMLVLQMVQSATKASTDKDRVKSNAVRALGNLLHFLSLGQLTRPVFQRPLEEAISALVTTVQSEATMKVRWNACYALGNAFRNPALPLDSASWSASAFSALCSVVISCQNFKVRIKSAAALSVPASRRCYGDAERFGCVWRSLLTALEHSEETRDFLEYRYCSALRHTLTHSLTHLLQLSQSHDMPALGASLQTEEGRGFRGHLVKYLRGGGGGVECEREGEGGGGEEGEIEEDGEDRLRAFKETLERLRGRVVHVLHCGLA
uniref:HEAT repeat-containing protein 6 n=1 Tax=Esox lucius TaxID=8010 RepID=A0A3P8YRI8_ESOLU